MTRLLLWLFAAFLSACASGPQLVPVTTPQTTSITFQIADGGTLYVGRFELVTSGVVKPTTTGLDVQSDVNASANVPISTGGTASTNGATTGTDSHAPAAPHRP